MQPRTKEAEQKRKASKQTVTIERNNHFALVTHTPVGPYVDYTTKKMSVPPVPGLVFLAASIVLYDTFCTKD